MAIRRTQCECTQLSVSIEGDPFIISACNCRNCQRRSGAPFYMNAWFKKSRIVEISGRSSVYERQSDFDRRVERHFCPDCGTQVYVFTGLFPEAVGLNALGFEDEALARPTFISYARSKVSWVCFPEGVQSSDTQPF
jgi:hypothetical protein